ncbi:hypothetical protein C8F04DRAFT_993059 [Mycena alexandri]|uniref:Uncharacterized protein n=1 Tax=Mycena alexandri TaxID=1745969 RepID=A0AAD6TAG9_9AGAR|nr:hypothetical protein C8F04DRAFT_993059 [Mycena alexandri]
MIVPSDPKPSDAADAPPAYDGPSNGQATIAEKRARRAPGPTSSTLPSASSIRPRQQVPKSGWRSLQDGVGGILADVGLGSAQQRAAQEVRKTVTGLVHDLVRDQTLDSNVSCVGILESCSEACATHSINMSSLLQQPYIEGHTPLYWAIVKRPTDESEAASEAFELPPLIGALLTYSAPLKHTTIREARLACLHICDQWLYQSLRLYFGALVDKDRLLLGVDVPPDKITVGIAARHDAPFTVDFEIPDFQKRMRVSRDANISFISHARMWKIQFFVANGDYKLMDGHWAVRLGLRENSPSTNVAATYILEETISDTTPGESVKLELSGNLVPEENDYHMHIALPDAVQYPRSPFLTADGTLCGKLTVQITK